MRTIKILLTLSISILLLALSGCKKCKNEDPRARIINNGSQKASVQIKTSGGNTENLNNVQPGSVSDFTSYAEGNVEFTISVGNKTNVVSNVNMQNCYEYDIAIDENGVVHATASDRNEK